MSMKVNKIQLELFIGEPETKPPIKDELSVLSGDGEERFTISWGSGPKNVNTFVTKFSRFCVILS
jgi:hypothetical protein